MSSSPCNSSYTSAENCCNSKIQRFEVEYIWIIDDFDFLEAGGKDLRSPTFSAATNLHIKWFLLLKLNCGETTKTNAFSFYVCLSPDSAYEIVYAKFTVFVLNSQQKEILIMSQPVMKYELNSIQSSWGRKIIKAADFRNNMLVNNTLTIKCKITFSLLRGVGHFNAAPMYANRSECNLVENLGMLLENPKFSDIVLSVKNKEYLAHKNILAARSSVFAAMFEHDLKEKDTNRVEIENMNEEVVAEMLRYIYTGKCENIEKLADGLFAAADKYNLDRLKIACAKGLYKTLSIDNALNILALADLHSVAELKSATIKFIVSKFADVVASTAWKNILVSHPDLINEVCQAVAGRPTSSGKRKDQDTSSESKRSRIE